MRGRHAGSLPASLLSKENDGTRGEGSGSGVFEGQPCEEHAGTSASRPTSGQWKRRGLSVRVPGPACPADTGRLFIMGLFITINVP